MIKSIFSEKKVMETQMNFTQGADSLEISIMSNLRKIIRAVNIYSKKMKEHFELNASQLSCIIALNSNGPIFFNQISKTIFLSPSMVTNIVDGLEKKGLVKRIPHPQDRRAMLAELTKKGKSIIKKAPPLMQKKLADGLLDLDEKEKNRINKSLLKLITLIEADVSLLRLGHRG